MNAVGINEVWYPIATPKSFVWKTLSEIEDLRDIILADTKKEIVKTARKSFFSHNFPRDATGFQILFGSVSVEFDLGKKKYWFEAEDYFDYHPNEGKI